RVEQYGQVVQERLSGDFEQAGAKWPPKKMVLIGLKEEKLLEVWVSQDGDRYCFLKSYPILGTSGKLGPKLKEGDLQVPEGLYRIESLNPNSRFHLSLRVNYPNAFDRKMAAREGRTNLGGDIMIHGSRCSIGCLAMGNPAAEDLFILAAETGVDNISVILSPVDFRVRDFKGDFSQMLSWVPGLYEQIKDELTNYSKRTD
ncbi:MAG: L,D-transpeptidase family protein, partial [Planctomycetota bacterium]